MSGNAHQRRIYRRRHGDKVAPPNDEAIESLFDDAKSLNEIEGTATEVYLLPPPAMPNLRRKVAAFFNRLFRMLGLLTERRKQGR